MWYGVTFNLAPRVFVPYCTGLTKRATLESSFTDRFWLVLTKIQMAGSETPRSSLVIHLKSGHAQFNRRSDIFGLQGSLVSRPLVKRNEDPGYQGAWHNDMSYVRSKDTQKQLVRTSLIFQSFPNCLRCFVTRTILLRLFENTREIIP